MLRSIPKTGTLTHCWWGCKVVQPLWKMICQFLIKLNINLPYDLAIPLLGIYPREMKTYPQKTCVQMLIALLFVIVKSWKQCKCPSIGEKINKL